MDFSRAQYIRDSSLEDLKNPLYIEQLMVKLGFNNEILHEQPAIVRQNGGGLHIWQYPNQFSKYLNFLRTLPISSYLEIGCRWGGSFIMTHEYLKRFHPMQRSIAVDIIDSPVQQYCDTQPETLFVKFDSQHEDFTNFMKQNNFDMIFIDGDHSYQGVKHDYETCKDQGSIFVFHDIVNMVCPGVVRFWNELKQTEKDRYDFYEFTEQYDDVWDQTGKTFLGIGVAVLKTVKQ